MYKLIGPSNGKTATFKVYAKEPMRSMIIGSLTAGADGEKIKASVTGDIVTLTFPDDTLAETFRSSWKN